MTWSSPSNDAAATGRMTARFRRRRSLGAAELFGVLALVAMAALALTAWTLAQAREERAGMHEAAGRVAAAWLMALHRSTMESDWSAAVAAGGALVTRASLVQAGHAPPGLPAAGRGMTMALGVIGDGTAQATAMSFLVVTPATAAASQHIHRGLIDAGIEGVEFAAGPPGVMAPHRAAIETLTGALAARAFFVTADTLDHIPAALYRRPQPGRPWLNRMEADLDLAGHDIASGGALHAGILDALDPAIDPLVPATWPGVTTASTTVVSTAAVVADPASLLAGSTALDPAVTPPGAGAASLLAGSSATVRDLDAAAVTADSAFAVTGDLVAGSLVASAALESVTAAIAGHLQAGRLQSTAARAQATAIGGATTVSRDVAAPEARTGAIAGSPAVDTATIAAAGGVYGPSLVVTGTLRAGSCSGC